MQGWVKVTKLWGTKYALLDCMISHILTPPFLYLVFSLLLISLPSERDVWNHLTENGEAIHSCDLILAHFESKRNICYLR